MPEIVAQDVKQTGQQDLTPVTLDGATDTFVVNASVKQLLILTNPTVSTINATMIGDGAPATATCQGIGEVTITPEAIDIDADGEASFYLNVIDTKLAGTVTITGGTGLTAVLLSL